MKTSGQTLELRQEAGGPRYYLDGEPIHAGTVLELKLADGDWLTGRYEWNYERGIRPLFCLGLTTETQTQGEVAFHIPEQAVLRWPAR